MAEFRENPFSCLVNEAGEVHLKYQLKITDAGIEDCDFQLPLLHKGDVRNSCVQANRFLPYQSMRLNGGIITDDSSINGGEDGNKKYLPFDVETETVRDLRLSNNFVNGANSVGIHGKLPMHSGSSVSAADVLKTLFFILVWYTFSTFLTLYNKTLLGDHLGKFPAPMLMNTVHFTIQAVLSKLITWYWSDTFQQNFPMSWNDYLSRDGLCFHSCINSSFNSIRC
ncbi:hypothetical protein SLEP1_g34561 [Rubroshorea leprosula]|uniref:Sugar phosphate transporter domain-containing protein n=1 Tax=Rubroshorea leprosula TaxID=152421 RepID=A0AAV5KKP3_9ROSI|nr:hypothetical protein SLEP1_g34561 [Rubroshorea leprosula]